MKKKADIMSKTGKWLLVFCVIFSKVSFPLSVLADEILPAENTEQENLTNITDTNDTETSPLIDIQTEEPIITINDKETTEYTISGIDDTKVEVVLNYQGNTEQETFDFSKKLYGIYTYTFTTIDKTVTINYLGNNADLLKNYTNVTGLTKELTCTSEECLINGFGTDLLTVADITTNYYNIEEFAQYYDAKVIITNEGQELQNTDTIINGYQLEIIDNQTNTKLINTMPNSSYTINRVGDVAVDGIIDSQDQLTILNDILKENDLTTINDVNSDQELNILDVTHSTFIDNTITEEVTDVLTNTLTPDKNDMLIEEEVEVKLLINGFDKQSLYGIEGILTYDSEILELVGAYADETTLKIGYLNPANNKFAFVLNGFNNTDSAVVTLKFKALSAGTTDIVISNIIESYGEAFELANDTTTATINVLEYGKGGDVEEENTNNSTTDTTIEETKKETETTITTVTQVKNIVKQVALSSDCYIKNLTIEGYDIDFDIYTYEYNIKVKNDVTSLNIDVLLNDSNSIYYIEGNEDFQVGENTVSIIVKAENGSTKTYTIKVEKEKEDTKKATEVDEEETEEEKSNTSKTIIIILIILVIIGLIYVIFKDDEEDAKEIKKSTQPEKKSTEVKETKDVKKTTKTNKNTKKGNKK